MTFDFIFGDVLVRFLEANHQPLVTNYGSIDKTSANLTPAPPIVYLTLPTLSHFCGVGLEPVFLARLGYVFLVCLLAGHFPQ